MSQKPVDLSKTAAEKQASRDEDTARLARGGITKEEFALRTSFLRR